MVDQRDIGVIVTLIGRLNAELLVLKAFNQIIIETLAKQSGLNIDSLYKEIESRQAKAVFRSAKVFSDLINQALDPDRQMTIEDLLKDIEGKS